MGGMGRICNGFIGQNPTAMDVLLQMNLEDAHFDCMRHAALSKLIERREGRMDEDSKMDEANGSKDGEKLSTTEKQERKHMKVKYADRRRLCQLCPPGLQLTHRLLPFNRAKIYA